MNKFKVAAVFSDRMVLQRGKNISVFGYGEDGANVTVEFEGNTVSARAKDGKWVAVLPPHDAAEGLTMTVSCGSEKKTFSEIAVGEVWLAGGQSNMELELQNCKGGKDVLKNDKDPNVRFYYTQKNCYMDETFYKNEENTAWSYFDEESAKCWSAVGYFFARDLAKRLGVTVGLIGCNWGGTSASAWMSRESLERDIDLKTYVDEYDEATKGKTDEQMIKEYREYQEYDAKWYQKSLEFYAKHPDGSWDEVQEYCGKNLYPGPQGILNPYHAGALYSSMVQRVCPYTIKGFIYYQGESDDHKPRMYYKLFRGLIDLWRRDWGDDELPFLMVQLPMHRYKADPDWKHWCLIREAQMKAYKTIKNTGIAVITDCGEFNEIHPKDKVPVGERLALQAMYHVYGDRSVKAFGPMYKGLLFKGGEIELMFDYAEDGFETKGQPSGFEIAGEDKKFVPADMVIEGGRITVSSKEVAEPKYVRYLWTNYGDVTIYGRNGIPLAPFRTCENDE